MESPVDSFHDLMARLKAGDQDAGYELFKRYTYRLIALVRLRLPDRVSGKFDTDDVLQSVYRSFFDGQARGKFARLDGWGSLWSLLAQIAVRKCGRKIDLFRADKREVAREVALESPNESGWEAVAKDPSPAEAAMLSETLERLMRHLDSHERTFLELALQGESAASIAGQTEYSERTVQRFLKKVRLRLERMNNEGRADSTNPSQ